MVSSLFVLWLVGCTLHAEKEAIETIDNIEDDAYWWIPTSKFFGSNYILIVLTVGAGMSLSSIFALQAKYLGECGSNGAVGVYFSINYLLMGMASVISFILLEIIW